MNFDHATIELKQSTRSEDKEPDSGLRSFVERRKDRKGKTEPQPKAL